MTTLDTFCLIIGTIVVYVSVGAACLWLLFYVFDWGLTRIVKTLRVFDVIVDYARNRKTYKRWRRKEDS